MELNLDKLGFASEEPVAALKQAPRDQTTVKSFSNNQMFKKPTFSLNTEAINEENDERDRQKRIKEKNQKLYWLLVN